MNKINKRKSWIFLILILILGTIYSNGFIYIPMYQDGDFFIAEWIFRDTNKGTIIGNPDFVPSFIEVTKNTFVDHYKTTADELGFDHSIEPTDVRAESNFDYAFLINDSFYIDYDEGFFIMDAEAYKTVPSEFHEVIRVLLLTLDPDAEINELDQFLSQETPIDFLDYNYVYLSTKVHFRFYNDDGPNMLQVEDARMGH